MLNYSENGVVHASSSRCIHYPVVVYIRMYPCKQHVAMNVDMHIYFLCLNRYFLCLNGVYVHENML